MINGINTSAVTIWWHPIKQRPAAPLSWVMSNDFLISDIVLSHFDYLGEVANKVFVVIEVLVLPEPSIPRADNDMLLRVPGAIHPVTIHTINATRACPQLSGKLRITRKVHLNCWSHTRIQFKFHPGIRNIQTRQICFSFVFLSNILFIAYLLIMVSQFE